MRKNEAASNQQTPTNKRNSKVNSSSDKQGSEDEPMEIDLEQYDDDINTVPQQVSNTATASSITSNRELLSKLVIS